VFLRFGVHLPRCGIVTFSRLSSTFASTFQRAPKMVLGRMLGPSLETDTVFDIALSGNSHMIAIACL
jgi:hypothetical protein